MNTYFKISAIIIISVIVSLSLPKNARDFSALLTLAVCACLIAAICNYADPIVDLVQKLSDLAGLDQSLLEVLLKITGIAIVAEFMVLICNESGKSTLGKGMQLLTTVVILWLSLPLFTMLMDVVKDVITVF